MARSKGTTKSSAKAEAKPRKVRAAKAVSTDNLPSFKSKDEVAKNTPLGKLVAKAGFTTPRGPKADRYDCLTSKGGDAVFAIVKTGKRTKGDAGNHIVTIHPVKADGTLDKPLAQANSVSAFWVK